MNLVTKQKETGTHSKQTYSYQRGKFMGKEKLGIWQYHIHLQEDMATHSSSLAWKIPWTEEPGRLQSMGSQRVEHDSVTIAHSHYYI